MNGDRTITTTASVFQEGDITPESVISDFFRPVATTLPQWDQGSSQVTNYSNVSMSSNHEDSSQGSALKNDHDTHSVNSSEHYESYNGSGNGEDQMFPITPPKSDQAGVESDQHDDYSEGPARKKRVPVPEEKKDTKYWDRRKKNNEAAKRSRDIRKRKVEDEIKIAREAITENQKLKQEIDVLKAEINSLRRLLRDANMTLSLWIRARQASEPNTQLPPMLRGSNVSFVNFPVTTNM